jgi:AraC-like DNA-binding protein
LKKKKISKSPQQKRQKISGACFEIGFKNLLHFSIAYKRQYEISLTGE